MKSILIILVGMMLSFSVMAADRASIVLTQQSIVQMCAEDANIAISIAKYRIQQGVTLEEMLVVNDQGKAKLGTPEHIYRLFIVIIHMVYKADVDDITDVIAVSQHVYAACHLSATNKMNSM